MKASTLRALRMPALSLLAFGILAIALLVFSDRLGTGNHSSGAQNTFRLDNASGLDSVNANGQHFTIDGLYVTGDKLDLRYHASGVSDMSFFDIALNPLFRNQPPTLITVASDGNVYLPYDATVGGQHGMPIIQGEFIWRFTGKPPHHLDISVVRLMGDTNASWTIHVDN